MVCRLETTFYIVLVNDFQITKKKIQILLELFFYKKTDVSPLLMSKAWVIKYNFKQKH